MSNQLQQMLDAQRELQIESYGADPCSLDGEELMDWIRWNVLACEDELHEALAETGWKPWSTSNHMRRSAFIGELVDAWHFFMNLMLCVGATDDELYAGYFAKRQINAKRQADGYDGVSTKCPVCGRALDDPHVACTRDKCAYEGKE